MNRIGTIAVAAALLSPPLPARAEAPRAGETYMISKSYETSGRTSEGSSSSSSGGDVIVERVVGVREDGLELEYDLPQDVAAEDKARQWQLPVRVLRPAAGPMRLLNRPELEARVEAWLKAAGLTREACGRWVFTWNAFRIDCDPESVLEAIAPYDLRSADLREGAPYRAREAGGAGTLARGAAGPNGASFSAVMEADPDAVRRQHAEQDVVVGEIMREPVTLEAALRERAKEHVSGTVTVTFEADAAGNALRRITVTKLETKRPDGVSESETKKEIVERRPLPAATARP